MYILKTDPLSHQKKEHEVSTLAQGHLSLLLDDSSDLSKRDNSNLGITILRLVTVLYTLIPQLGTCI